MDWIAAILELFGNWTIGNKKRYAFLLFLACNFAWIYVAITRHVYGLLIVVVPAIFINVRNFSKWGKSGAS